jgi:hypothetical protein
LLNTLADGLCFVPGRDYQADLRHALGIVDHLL